MSEGGCEMVKEPDGALAFSLCSEGGRQNRSGRWRPLPRFVRTASLSHGFTKYPELYIVSDAVVYKLFYTLQPAQDLFPHGYPECSELKFVIKS